jgi:hypothetical protein
MRLPILLVPLALAACTPPLPPPTPEPPHIVAPPPDQPAPRADLASCGGDAVAGLIGQNVSALPASGSWGALRIVRPGMMITMDYSAMRLNVNIDGSGTILALSCG